MARNYINPKVVAATMEILSDYKDTHPMSKTPMCECAANIPTTDRARFVRAAQRLGWNVTKTLGHIYENGYFAW